MENPQNQQQTANDNITPDHMNNNNNNKATNGNNNGGFLCRQSSSRWTPTTDQIRILKELYYTNGMRSPTAEQIQKISARLRQYGKIEGKNVFYWFQNHKARERQKKRFTSDHHNHLHTNNLNNVMQRNNVNGNNTTSDLYQAFHHGDHIKYSNLSTVVSSTGNASSASVIEINGQMVNCPYGYGGMTNIEKAFRLQEQCGSSGANGGSMGPNPGWVGSVDPYSSPYRLFDRRSTIPIDDIVDEDQTNSPEIQTLPLFPMHGGEINGGGGFYSGWYSSDQGGGVGHVSTRTSLELSLNCYCHRSPDSI